MSFPKYPAYKDSGVEWLGEVPSHWSVTPLKWLAEQITDKANISDFQVGLENIQSWTGRLIETDTEFSGDGIAFRHGDILFGKLRPYLAKVWFSERAGQAVGDFFVLRPSSIKGDFLAKYILTPSVIEDLNASTIGAKMPRVGWEDMAALAVALPPDKEQTQIARFLDHETARIDALIEEQQRLIELLKEKRQAVISHAVTKGLDPTVPMKDSGVEWLGEVPAHWNVKALRYLGECQNGINIGGEAFGSGFPFVSYGDVYKNEVLPGEVKGLVQSSLADRQRYSVKAGDVFFTRTSETIDEIGFSATCLREIPDAVFAGFLIRFRPSGKSIHHRFSKYYFRNHGLRIFFNKEMNLVTRASLSQDLLKLLPVALPPLSEQIEIADYLDGVSTEFSSLLEHGLRSIDLLTERRSALISAAVTGKIDVRNWQPPAGQHPVGDAHNRTELEAV